HIGADRDFRPDVFIYPQSLERSLEDLFSRNDMHIARTFSPANHHIHPLQVDINKMTRVN
ncbi:MAG: hypothetical protein ABSG67_21855, partial [Thermoguttaceae bacterium]